MNSYDKPIQHRVVDRQGLDDLISEIRKDGFEVVGPRIKDGVVVYDHIESTGDLPVGWGDVQEPGRYRLARRTDEALFAFVVGPQAIKKYLFPPVQRLYQVVREGKELRTIPEPHPSKKLALFGVRGCELAALSVQDKVFLGGAFVDPLYQKQRANLFIVAVDCNHPAETCFCRSMGTGPDARDGFDIAITELLTDARHDFLISAGTARGEKLVDRLSSRPATREDIRMRDHLLSRATNAMSRTLDLHALRDLLYQHREHPRWEETAARCVSCGNCTLVCPTCFCSTVEDTTDLSGDRADRTRKWDSCFTSDFSYIVGGSVRSSTRAKYRHWLTHKLAAWQDQFGVIGCTGCGRCITWCPVGIDLTEEVAAIRGREANLSSHRLAKENQDARKQVQMAEEPVL